jgi:hypothetical protein
MRSGQQAADQIFSSKEKAPLDKKKARTPAKGAGKPSKRR